jgi:hypothetical protein
VELLRQNETHKAIKLLGSEKLSKYSKIIIMKEGKPSAVPTQELANLLINSTEEIMDEQLDFCSMETRKLISEFICKDIATFKHHSETSEIK